MVRLSVLPYFPLRFPFSFVGCDQVLARCAGMSGCPGVGDGRDDHHGSGGQSERDGVRAEEPAGQAGKGELIAGWPLLHLWSC